MGVDVAWVDENHREKQHISDSLGVISRLAMSRWPKMSNTVCLRFVDACGDAVFNQMQISDLLLELRQEVVAQTEPKFKLHLETVVNLVEQATNRSHTYIKFMGD
jgi:hypothetical protein